MQLLGVAPMAVVPEIRNSRFHAGRTRRLLATTVSLAIAAPLVYFTVWSLAR
jgi:hypothetical protein